MSSVQKSSGNWFARHKVLTAAGAVTAVLVIGGVASNGGGDNSTQSASPSATKQGSGTSPQAKSTSGQQQKAAGIDGSGTYKVGTDIKPGTYKSTGNKDDNCYWERAKDATGNTDSILANDNVTGTSYVTIKASDKYFKSDGCGAWVAVTSTTPAAPMTELPGNGMYKVGTDIKPGTYKSTGNKDDNCYWERAKDATGNTDSILANDNVSGTVLVTVKASDAYFKSAGCTAWKKS